MPKGDRERHPPLPEWGRGGIGIVIPALTAGACSDAYFEVEVAANPAAYGTTERYRITAMVCLHKVDLAEPGECDAMRTIYEGVGYDVLLTSATTGSGIEALRDTLRGHTSAFMGVSGAGKSRLIAALQPGLVLRMGIVNQKSGQGRHTTTRVDLHCTEFGALLADTPGVREFSLWGLQPEELGELFPEFRDILGECRFATCTHDHEPRCAVKAAVEAGRTDAGRYQSYLAILAELRQDVRAGGRPDARRQEDEHRDR